MDCGLYIFLTNTISGCSGGVVYVRNKLVWLKKQGWRVIVYDSGGQIREPILFPELKPFIHNHIYEFYYPPCYSSKFRRTSVLQRLTAGTRDEKTIVVESNTMELSEWGEFISQVIKAKHLVYLIQENLLINSKDQYQFMKYKANNNELFSINPQAYRLLFSRYEDVKDAEVHFWQAGNASPILEIENERIERLPPVDITISHFGRQKNYFKYMINEISLFANHHNNLKFNLLLLGIDSFRRKEYSLPNNLNVIPLGSINPIPCSFYSVSDVIVATAGCASMSFRYGATVISMDTSTDLPLGVMGFTTLDRTYRSKDNHNQKDLSVLLEEVLIERKYCGDPLMELPATGKKYDYHLSFALMSPAPYYNTLGIDAPCSINDYRDYFFLKLGLVKVRTMLRYLAFRVRNSGLI